MGHADIVTREYMRKNEIFADAFNYMIYGGRPVIDPEGLRELDTAELALPFGAADLQGNAQESVQKYRDILKSAVIKQDEHASYILLGIENQQKVHYAMPVRNMLYDALQYDKQVKAVASAHRQKKGSEPCSSAEYLSGIYRQDRITPVITLVMHFGAEEWDGPRSLFEMMDVGDPALADFIQDYRIHLIDPAGLKDEELQQFSTNLREVLGYIRCSKDRQQLEAYIKDNPRMTMEADAARVISVVTRTPFKIDEASEVINVCKAIDEMMADSRAAGISEGMNEGVAKGRTEGSIFTLADLVRDGLIPLKVAAERVSMTEAEFAAAASKLS
ncbi:MAG: Rpn family recombination-promoting nuclease/putative transposase [Anaerovoracaceae bacterium]